MIHILPIYGYHANYTIGYPVKGKEPKPFTSTIITVPLMFGLPVKVEAGVFDKSSDRSMRKWVCDKYPPFRRWEPLFSLANVSLW